MGIFGNPNKKVERLINKLEKQGFSSESYKTRKCCERCAYFRPGTGHCNCHNQRTTPSNYCHQYWEK